MDEVSAGDDASETTFLDDRDLPPARPNHERPHALGGVFRRDCDLPRLHDAPHRLLSPLVLQRAIHGIAGDQSHDVALLIHYGKPLMAGVEHTVGDVQDRRLRGHGTDAVGHQIPHDEMRVYEAGHNLPQLGQDRGDGALTQQSGGGAGVSPSAEMPGDLIYIDVVGGAAGN